VACATDDIIQTVQTLRRNGVEFTTTPAAYYQTLYDRVGKIDEDIDTLREQNILVDRDSQGYLMQIFSRPVQSRPTVFFEIIQRKGADGFGSGNIKALFEAVARDQAMRGNA
jgi:4-hydroxyphenylpyruvate dioxygenase